MEKLKVALVSDWYFPKLGGIEVAIHELAKNLSRIGLDVTIVTNLYPGCRSLESDENGFKVVRIPASVLKRADVSLNPSSYVRLHRILKYGGFNIVHGHSIYSPLAAASIHDAKGILGIPTVVTNHSLLGSNSLNHFYLGLLNYELSRADAVTAVSRAVVEDTLRIRPSANVFWIPNCIDVKEWAREKVETLRDLDGDPVITSVQRLSRRKNPYLLVHAASRILKEATKAKIYIAGDGPERELLARMVYKKGLSDKIRLLGPLPRPMVKKLLASTDIYVSTSRYEAFGIAVLEALAMSNPVVAVRGGGIPDLVIHGYNGLLSDERGFSQHLLALIEDGGLRRKMAHNARVWAGFFDCRRIAGKYLEIYRYVLEKKCLEDKRMLAYRIFRRIVGNPVKPGERCIS